MKLAACALMTLAAIRCALAAEPLKTLTGGELRRSREMLRVARDETIQRFHDAGRVGAAFRSRCDATEKALEYARSVDEARLMIAQVFLDLGDSYTRFVPPGAMSAVNHHWTFHAVGNEIYVNAVDRGSEAEKKGLRVGDKVLAVDGIAPSRANSFLLGYLLYGLAPRSGMRVVVQSPNAEPRRLDIPGELKKDDDRTISLTKHAPYFDFEASAKNRDDHDQLIELPEGIVVWRLGRFDAKKTAAGLRKASAAKSLILDLRGNKSDQFRAADGLLKALWSEEFEAYSIVERKKTTPVKIKGRGDFTGLLLVLVDYSSASASEVFARTVQMKQRGILLGDRTGGHVLGADYHPLIRGDLADFTPFGMVITDRTAVMNDGYVIEGKGVGPDYLILPTHEEIYLGHDPVLAKALSIAGRKTTAEDAGKLYSSAN